MNSYKGEILQDFYSYQAIVEYKCSVKNGAPSIKLPGSLPTAIYSYNVERGFNLNSELIQSLCKL